MAFSQGFTAEVPISLSITSFIDKHSFLKRAHNSVSGRRKRTGVPGMRVSKCEDAEFERAIRTTRMPAGRSCLSERLSLACSSRLRLGEIASQPHHAKDHVLPVERLAGRDIERLNSSH